MTPPAALPIPLATASISDSRDFPKSGENMFESKEKDITSSNKESNRFSYETPKSSLKTHKRYSSTVLQKKQQKRVSLGEKLSSVVPTTTNDRRYTEQTISDATMSAEEISASSSSSHAAVVCVPSSKLEATTLLRDIKERRVSTVGLDQNQISNLSKLIAALTGVDEELVCQLISLLPRKQPGSQTQAKSTVQETSTSPNRYSLLNSTCSLVTVCAPCLSAGTHSSSYTSVNSVHKVAPYPTQQNMKPISSVLPINANRFESGPRRLRDGNNDEFPYSRSSDTTDIGGDFLPTTRIPDRYSDPSPRFDRIPTDQRQAVSISPVRNNPSIASHNFSTHHPVHSEQLPFASTSQFFPLGQSQASTIRSTSDTTLFQNAIQISNDYNQLNSIPRLPNLHSSSGRTTASWFGSVSDHDSLIHADSLSFPKDVTFDICCVGTSKSHVISLKNDNRCWIQCQLHVVFFAFNGREVNFHFHFQY